MLSNIRLTATTFCLLTLLMGCSSQPTQPQVADKPPEPRTIRLYADGAPAQNRPGASEKTVEKDLFVIRASNKQVLVNDTKISGLNVLEQLLEDHPDSVITIEAHKCLSGADTAKILTLAQQYTETPIPFGSYGSEDDADC